MLTGGIGLVASGTNSRPVGAGNNEEANRATAAETEIIRSFMRTPWLSYVNNPGSEVLPKVLRGALLA